MYALDLLNKTYGSVVGVTDFFEKMSRKENLWPILYIFASHPYPASRIAGIKENIKLKGYVIGQKMPLTIKIKEDFSKNN